MSDLRALLDLVLSRYQLDPRGIHGVAHWARVLENARRLAPATGADGEVLELFAIFHDACRRNDGHDPGHGPRAAELVLGLREKLGLDDERLAVLAEACRCHTHGPLRGVRASALSAPEGAHGPPHGATVTVLTCLDADRLDISRVGMRVRPELLFSDAARDPRMIRWASRRAAGREVPRLCVDEWGWDG